MSDFDARLLNGIGILSAIVDTGSFAGAGEVVNMSQSGVSRAIARLERRLGIRLLDRTPRAVTLTDEGRRLYDRVMPLLAALGEATASETEATTTVRGRLRVNVDPFFSRLFLGPALGTFMETYGELNVELITRDHLGDMISDGFDLAVRFGHPQPSSLIARKLLETRILTVASPSYIARHGQPKQPVELATGSHTCIRFRDPATGHPFDWEFCRGQKKIVVDVGGDC